MHLQDEADEDLMLRYRDGDAAAFEVLYARHKGPLFRYVRRQCSDPHAAEELFQDVWANLIRARRRYRVRARFTTYLYRIAHNRIVDWYASRGRRPGDNPGDGASDPVADLPAGDADRPDTRADLDQQVARVQTLLAEMPREQREAFLLSQEGGLTAAEIARATGVGKEAAKSRLRYAIARLRRGLEAQP